MKIRLMILLALTIASITGFAENYPLKKVLILVEGNYNLNSKATGQGRELAQLMGHFNTSVVIEGTNSYKGHEIDKYDYLFYVGFSSGNEPPYALCHDVITTSKPVIWINSGFPDFCRKEDVQKKFGFSVLLLDKSSGFDVVKTQNYTFSKGIPDTYKVQIKNKTAVEVWATAFSTKTKTETPYMIKSANLVYVADLPFLGAEVNDRYLFFSDKLHDILNENHAESHQAIIRIEDVTPLNDPDKLREVADILSERGIPFLVGVVPIYVNPQEAKRVTLSERPELVDALKYMVQNGGSIVMHGTTHQYKGVSTDDGEFWDANEAKPIPNENAEDFKKKIELGIDEFVKNGLHPIAWETPHYMASVTFLEVISKFFSTAVEQRMVINDFDYGQYFPYIINKDIYGQKIYPENLGYVPLRSNIEDSKAIVQKLISSTDGIKQVRDGVACGFFHPFLNLEMLKTLVDGIAAKGFTFIDLKDQTNWVKSNDKVILNGAQSYNLSIDNSYLHEQYYNQDNKLTKNTFSETRLKGLIKRNINLNSGETYVAEAAEYKVNEPTIKEKLITRFNKTYRSLFDNNDWQQAHVKIIWNPAAKGAAYFDQSSFVAVFSSLNVAVDTLFIDEKINLDNCNLLIVPFTSADLLSKDAIREIIHFVGKGGNLITDRKNKLIGELGINFNSSQIKLHFIRDKYYPEEPIAWKVSQLANKFDYNADDVVFCEDASSGLPVAIGRVVKEGKIIYLNTAFDPLTPYGYSYYPFIMEYIGRFLGVQPVFKRENLEMYFDPGFRRNTSEEELVKRWVKEGIRIIHVAGWHQYPKYTYDYERLIKVAHANGILVYAWIEPPQVSQKFWTEHPEWREKNYLNQDIHKDEILKASWRYPVALIDKQCFKAASTVYLDLLKKFDFDGVNIAELNFEAGKGFNDPKVFTPMHPSACKDFRNRYGYDLKDIFKPSSSYYWKNNPKVKDQVTKYRSDKVYELHDALLAEIKDFAKSRKGFNVIVTFYDSYFSPEITEYYGVSSENMIRLQKKYNFMLQPEDPQNKWSSNPDRYIEMGRWYAQKISDSTKLMLDLNILNFRGKEEMTPFPTLMQTGLESYQLINSASKGASRFTVYSESSCNPQDLSFFSYASSGMVNYITTDDGFQGSSPYSFILQLPKDIKAISVDGENVIGYRENHYLIPAGEHTIITHLNDIPGFSTDELQPELLSFTGNLLSIDYEMRKISLNYKGDERTLASLNNKPTSIVVDGKAYEFEVLRGNDCFTVMLPPGNHQVDIVTGDRFSYGINLASLWSISAIAIYGFVAVVLLVIMFVALKFIRRRYEM
jgi:uncharacterized protein YdaL